MMKEHRRNVVNALNYLVSEKGYSIVGIKKKSKINVGDYYISVNHEQKQIILRNKEDAFSNPAFMKFRNLIGE